MASSNVDSSHSEDDVFCDINRRRFRPRDDVHTDSSDESGDEAASRPRGAVYQIVDSASSTDDELFDVRDSFSLSPSSEAVPEDCMVTVINSSSDNEQSNKCAICLSKFLDQEVARPEPCFHIFCSECLQKWAKKINTCPIDRQKFDTIFVKKPSTGSVRIVHVLHKGQSRDDDSDSSVTRACRVCGGNDRRREFLVCDECGVVYHRECLNSETRNNASFSPWWCPSCTTLVHFGDRMTRNFQELDQRRFRPSPYRSSLSLHQSPNSRDSVIANANDSSSSDSDENTEFTTSNTRRNRCQEIRNRRQNRVTPSRVESSSSLIQSILQRADGFSLTSDDEEYAYDYNYDGIERILSIFRRHMYHRVKRFMLTPSTAVPSKRVDPASSLTDIVDDILQLEAYLRTPGFPQRDGMLAQDTSPVVQQCPLNPSQTAPSKCGNSDSTPRNATFTSSSSSSSGSGSSQCRDLYSMPGCSMLQNNSNADGYDTDSCSMVTHRSYGSSSVPEELKQEDRDSKENSKTHSDEEVDIYSDIESTNEEETSMDTEMQIINTTYKPDESHIPSGSSAATHANAVDGSDSSDNDLVIDEDMPVEEDCLKPKLLASYKPMDTSLGNNDTGSNGNSSNSGSDDDDDASLDENKATISEGIQSPNRGDTNHNDHMDFQSYNDSCDSLKKSSECRSDDPKELYGDSDSRDVNSTGNEADEENSTHSLKGTASVEQSHDFDQNNSSDAEASRTLCFDLKGMTSALHMHGNEAPVGKEPDLMDSGSSLCGVDAAENASDNEQDAFHSDNFQIDDGSISDKFPSAEQIDSNCSTSKNEENDDMEDVQSDLSQDKNFEVMKKDNDDVEDVSDADKVNSNAAFDEKLSNDQDFLKEDDVSMDFTGSDEKVLLPYQQKSSPCSEKSAQKSDEDDVDDDEENLIDDNNAEGAQEDLVNNEVSHKLEDIGCEDIDDEKDGKNVDDLGIEDISDAASDDLNHHDSSVDDDQFNADQTMADDVEKNVAQLFEQDSSPESQLKGEVHRTNTDEGKRLSSSQHSLQDDQEEGEIIDDIPYHKRDHRRDYFAHDDEDDYMDSAPRVNISDLPRIPKIKRDTTKVSEVEEVPLEVKRTSVLGRVDLGSSDISWKRLSQHTRERSYRDGRPKDESVMFRDRELKQKERKSKNSFSDRKNEDKHRESDRNKKEDNEKQESSKSRDRSTRDRKSDRAKNDREKSSRDKSHSTSEKRDKEKHGKSHDRGKDKHDRDQSKSERESKKEKRDKHKDKSSRDHDKYDKYDKGRSDDKYRREVDRYDLSDDQYERTFEKPREKEHKHKHKDRRESRDRKSEGSSKKSKDEKRKRSHSNDHYSEKQKEREVRKIDDKLKIVVEHKEAKKDKGEKHSDKKHDKKHRENSHHHHERKKKEVVTSPYSDIVPPPIESKEIFAKGDSIIINVNFNRASPREVLPAPIDDFVREKKSSLLDLPKIESSVDENSKSKHLLHDKENIFIEAVTVKGPSTPDGRTDKTTPLSVGESYWQENDDDAGSPSVEKSIADKSSSDKEGEATPIENYGADDNLTDSDENQDQPQTQPKSDEEFSEVQASEKKPPESTYGENKEAANNARRRSPHPPSPPSPADNDSYDPCEPTRSPSPPPSPPVPPPLPSKSIDLPKPPPSPELPPLPPGPEPIDAIPRDDLRSMINAISTQSVEIPPVSSSLVSAQPTAYTQTIVSESGPVPNILMPPPSFPPRSTSVAIQSPMLPPKTVNWQVPNPPPAPLMMQQNHVQPIIRGNFLPSHIPTMGMPPQNVSATVLPPTNSVSLMSQVRHLQLATHGVLPNSTLLPNVPMNFSPMQMSHLTHPVTNAITQHTMASLPNLQNNLSTQAPAVVRLMSIQNQLPNIAVTIQNQHIANVLQSQPLSHFLASQNQVQTPIPAISQKLEKLQKISPEKEKSEVVDMDVDSPYSPGDSPSMDSNYDYSPPTSPSQKSPPGVAQQSKDPFDNLLGAAANQEGNKTSSKSSNKNRHSSNCTDTPNKKMKLDKSDSATKSRHSIRLHVSDKKSRKDKLSDKKDLLTKLDDSQLKILDELPSSAVEMQVKQKFLKKLNRQERVVEEVKMALKPYYKTREVNKEEYKDILRKSVPKICHNKSGEINPMKIKHLVESYIKKVKHSRKKASKCHKSGKFS